MRKLFGRTHIQFTPPHIHRSSESLFSRKEGWSNRNPCCRRWPSHPPNLEILRFVLQNLYGMTLVEVAVIMLPIYWILHMLIRSIVAWAKSEKTTGRSIAVQTDGSKGVDVGTQADDVSEAIFLLDSFYPEGSEVCQRLRWPSRSKQCFQLVNLRIFGWF